MDKFVQTEIPQALKTIVFKLLKMNVIYGFSDEEKYSDHHGNVRPGGHLLYDGSTLLDLDRNIHSGLAEDYVLAIDTKTDARLPADYNVRNKDVIETQKHAMKKSA